MDKTQSIRDSAGHIRNPLTVISRFAAVAEISGTAVLPFIEPANQATYIWFLMLFPAFLVGLFFLTLNFNHKTLYAPSDYKNQNHFLNLFGITTADERRDKLEAELQEESPPSPNATSLAPPDPLAPEASEQEPSEADNPENESRCPKEHPFPEEACSDMAEQHQERQPLTHSILKRPPTDERSTSLKLETIKEQDQINLRNKLQDIESKAIAKLLKTTKISFDRNLKIETADPDHPIIFDGMSITSDEVHATEIKYFDSKGFSVQRVLPTLNQAAHAAQLINRSINRKFIFYLIVVVNKPLDSKQVDVISLACQRVAAALGLITNVYVIEADKLLSEEGFTFYERRHPKG
ncbi:hypothetical protein ACNFG0_09045 [Pseudomonas sp. NY15372]|uniref:hypothetical protein n=1 Tax=Pseudomonas sp. NY15372 TaxID=3400356 RepID=UPI003A88B703